MQFEEDEWEMGNVHTTLPVALQHDTQTVVSKISICRGYSSLPSMHNFSKGGTTFAQLLYATTEELTKVDILLWWIWVFDLQGPLTMKATHSSSVSFHGTLKYSLCVKSNQIIATINVMLRHICQDLIDIKEIEWRCLRHAVHQMFHLFHPICAKC